MFKDRTLKWPRAQDSLLQFQNKKVLETLQVKLFGSQEALTVDTNRLTKYSDHSNELLMNFSLEHSFYII